MAAGKLTGKVAIVTGASTGIGQATARAFVAEGAKVAIVARSADKLEALAKEFNSDGDDANSMCLAYAADVSDAAAVARVVANVIHEWGKVDVFVANAGTNTKQRNLNDMSPEQWDTVVGANMSGVFYCAKAVLPQMREQGGGAFITVASMAARGPGVMSGVAYASSKAGAVSVTGSINAEERTNNIRACAILPGEVATPILELRPNPPDAYSRSFMLQPEDVAAAVVFVASLPDRVTIDQLLINPTVQRDRAKDEAPPSAREK